MKKLFFTAIALVAFSAVSFAGNVEVKKEEPKKEVTCLKKQKMHLNVTSINNKDIKTVTCSVYANGQWNSHSYSCFFCWGGSANGCIASAANALNIVL